MKNIIKILTIILLFISSLILSKTYATYVDFWNVQWWAKIEQHSNYISNYWNINDSIANLWLNILTFVKYIVSALLILYLVYAWIQMIISMWNDEEKLSSSKRQLRYTIVWIIFINMPWIIYWILDTKKTDISWNQTWYTWSSSVGQNMYSVFIETYWFKTALNWWIILFIETLLFSVAVFIIMLEWIKLITARWREEQISEAKNKIVWAIIGLIFIGFIEAWQAFVYNWVVSDWANLFLTIEKLTLFFAWPIAIFFLTLAWWYYITSAWDEEKVKKAKNIIIYTLIGSIILLAAHTFLKDLITLTLPKWNL